MRLRVRPPRAVQVGIRPLPRNIEWRPGRHFTQAGGGRDAAWSRSTGTLSDTPEIGEECIACSSGGSGFKPGLQRSAQPLDVTLPTQEIVEVLTAGPVTVLGNLGIDELLEFVRERNVQRRHAAISVAKFAIQISERRFNWPASIETDRVTTNSPESAAPVKRPCCPAHQTERIPAFRFGNACRPG